MRENLSENPNRGDQEDIFGYKLQAEMKEKKVRRALEVGDMAYIVEPGKNMLTGVIKEVLNNGQAYKVEIQSPNTTIKTNHEVAGEATNIVSFKFPFEKVWHPEDYNEIFKKISPKGDLSDMNYSSFGKPHSSERGH